MKTGKNDPRAGGKPTSTHHRVNHEANNSAEVDFLRRQPLRGQTITACCPATDIKRVVAQGKKKTVNQTAVEIAEGYMFCFFFIFYIL